MNAIPTMIGPSGRTALPEVSVRDAKPGVSGEAFSRALAAIAGNHVETPSPDTPPQAETDSEQVDVETVMQDAPTPEPENLISPNEVLGDAGDPQVKTTDLLLTGQEGGTEVAPDAAAELPGEPTTHEGKTSTAARPLSTEIAEPPLQVMPASTPNVSPGKDAAEPVPTTREVGLSSPPQVAPGSAPPIPAAVRLHSSTFYPVQQAGIAGAGPGDGDAATSASGATPAAAAMNVQAALHPFAPEMQPPRPVRDTSRWTPSSAIEPARAEAKTIDLVLERVPATPRSAVPPSLAQTAAGTFEIEVSTSQGSSRVQADVLVPLQLDAGAGRVGSGSGAAQIEPRPILHQIAEAATKTPGGSVELRLSPEELGRVRITMTQSDVGLAIVVNAERDDTLSLLRRHAAELATAMRDAGLGEASIQFADRGAGEDARRPVQKYVFRTENGLIDEAERVTRSGPSDGALDVRL